MDRAAERSVAGRVAEPPETSVNPEYKFESSKATFDNASFPALPEGHSYQWAPILDDTPHNNPIVVDQREKHERAEQRQSLVRHYEYTPQHLRQRAKKQSGVHDQAICQPVPQAMNPSTHQDSRNWGQMANSVQPVMINPAAHFSMVSQGQFGMCNAPQFVMSNPAQFGVLNPQFSMPNNFMQGYGGHVQTQAQAATMLNGLNIDPTPTPSPPSQVQSISQIYKTADNGQYSMANKNGSEINSTTTNGTNAVPDTSESEYDYEGIFDGGWEKEFPDF